MEVVTELTRLISVIKLPVSNKLSSFKDCICRGVERTDGELCQSHKINTSKINEPVVDYCHAVCPVSV